MELIRTMMNKIKNIFWLSVVFATFFGLVVIFGALVKLVWVLFKLGFDLWL